MGRQKSEQSRIYGLHAVSNLLETEAGTAVKEIWLHHRRRDRRMERVVQLARQLGVKLHQVERHELDRMAPGARHQGIIAAIEGVAPLSESGLEVLLDESKNPLLILVLDGVQDPHNLGACLRAADGAGVVVVIAPRDRAVGVTPAVSKVASGAAETVPFVQVTNLARTLRMLKERGIWVVGLDDSATDSLFATDLRESTALVLGNEGKGLRRLTREQCDALAAIPMAGTVSSLNVSMAAGICLFEAVRQRMEK